MPMGESLDNDKKISPLGKENDVKRIENRDLRYFCWFNTLLRLYGIRYIFEKLLCIYELPDILKNKKIWMIVLKCWPNLYNIDLEENKKCTSLYYKNGKSYPFCYYNIIDGKRCP
jgi:hypothetical protein